MSWHQTLPRATGKVGDDLLLGIDSRQRHIIFTTANRVGHYPKTAWFVLRRIREAYQKEAFMLEGGVETDETCIGGQESNTHANKKLRAGRGAVGKTAMLGMRERGGQVKAMPMAIRAKQHYKARSLIMRRLGSAMYAGEHSDFLASTKNIARALSHD